MFKLLKHMVEVLEKEKMFYIMMIVILNKLWKMNNKIIKMIQILNMNKQILNNNNNYNNKLMNQNNQKQEKIKN